MIQYLEQVGIFKDDNYGIIDLGTGATLHNALGAVLETCNLKPPKSFYLGLRNIPNSKYGLPETYMYDLRKKLGFTDSPGLITLLEAICSADHGSVIGYGVSEGVVKPIFKEESNQAVIDWGYQIVRDTILDFTEHLFLDDDLLNPWGELRAMNESLLQEFWLHPTVKEARAWGSFPMEDGWGEESTLLTLAPPYSIADVLNIFVHWLRNGKIPQRRHLWKYGAFMGSKSWIRLPFEIFSNLRYAKKKLRMSHLKK